MAGKLIDTIGMTPLVKLEHLAPNNGSEVWVKLEGSNPAGSVKDRAARSMIEEAEKRGDIKPGTCSLRQRAATRVLRLR